MIEWGLGIAIAGGVIVSFVGIIKEDQTTPNIPAEAYKGCYEKGGVPKYEHSGSRTDFTCEMPKPKEP